ncbi:permease family-domain-containing protein [Xylariaceae sp. FL0594]|nr:permease family-domain-containing protein [Xylariaceae sp. FL0594]
MDEDQGPSQIIPHSAPKRSLGDRFRGLKKTFLTREGLFGDYDYAFLFRPNLPFLKKHRQASPFFGLNDKLPVFLALLLGFQHALAMLAGVITPPIILSGAAGVNLETNIQQYLVSTALIVCGILSMIQITRFHIKGTPYYIGTGLISVVGVSFTIIPVAQGAFAQMYANGFCPSAEDGTRLPCPDAYGALIGTAAVAALIEIVIAFMPPRLILKIFPPLVTGPTVMLIGIGLIESGFKNWLGGSGPCSDPNHVAFFDKCPDITAPHALPWGSPEYLGLGFSVFITIILCERFGSPIMKSTSVIIGLLTGVIIAAATGYFSRSGIDQAPVASFVWVHTFKLSVYGPLVLPLIAVFIICACEAIGDITATCDVSRLEVEGELYETRIQGGVLADGINGVLAALATLTPMTTFAQNNGVIALTRCANRTAGYCCCLFLILAGIFAKFAAALVAIPAPVLGGMTTFLFCSVAVSGIAIVSRGVPFTRRNRFILTAGLALGYGATLVPAYFSRVFTYEGENRSLRGFLDAIELVVETGYAITALVTIILNLVLPEEEIVDTVEETVVATSAAGADGGVPPYKHEAGTATDHSRSVDNGKLE